VNDWFDALTTPSGSAAALVVGLALTVTTRWQPRLGWIGIPLGTILAVAFSFLSIGWELNPYLADYLPIGLGLVTAGIMGSRLPRPDSWLALLAAPVIAYVVLVLPSGPDSPLALYEIASVLGFMMGAAASAVTSSVRSRRLRKVATGV
jgi:hypothetical protein